MSNPYYPPGFDERELDIPDEDPAFQAYISAVKKFGEALDKVIESTKLRNQKLYEVAKQTNSLVEEIKRRAANAA